MPTRELTYIDAMNVEDIVPYDRNARLHGSELEFLKNSIRQFGFVNPMILDENFTIIAGHGRLQAAKSLNIKTVPAIICSGLTPDQVDALRLVDNQTSDMSTWNLDLLNEELNALGATGWFLSSDFGFTVPDFDVGESDPEPEEETQAAEPETISTVVSDDELLNLLVYCPDVDTRDEIEAFLLKKNIQWKELSQD